METYEKQKADHEALLQVTDFTITAIHHDWPNGKVEQTNQIEVQGSARLTIALVEYVNKNKETILAAMKLESETLLEAARQQAIIDAQAVIDNLTK